jgi:hypothetical protein
VVTDLDTSSEEEDNSQNDEDECSLRVSPSILRHLKTLPQNLPLPSQATSQALVLYQPLMVRQTMNVEHAIQEQPTDSGDREQVDENAMDVGE